MSAFLRWAGTPRSLSQRIGFLALGALLFLGAVPLLLLFGVPTVDAAVGIEHLLRGPVSLAAGLLLIVIGGVLAVLTIEVQVTAGAGTPFPMAPTQRLLTTGPFGWCRNPMALGTILACLGLGLAVGSPASVLVVCVAGGLLLLFIRRVEERELTLRFGDEYLAYRAATPFLLPRRPKPSPHRPALRSGRAPT
jgi:protein-S-isoprenylcysteine O-methyltransferase Ste14